MAVGLGAYGALGRPQLALASLTAPTKTDYPALISMLAQRMPNRKGCPFNSVGDLDGLE